jgi:acetyltransferase-like isoleucine patch superfamily enzyme
MARQLAADYDPERLVDLYGRFAAATDEFSATMRRVVFRALARGCGNGLTVSPGVKFCHLETFTFGEGVFLGADAVLQGRFDGKCVVGDYVWIGPQAFLDARDLLIEEYVGWGPGAKVLGSEHTGEPPDVPIIQTDLKIRPVRIGAWSDIGTNAVILPGVTVGKGSIVGAGAVVTSHVEAFSVVAGVPAKVLHRRARAKAARKGR